MIIPDLNLLLYAYNAGATHHRTARRWWEGLLAGDQPVGIPWVVILGFIRLSTTRGVFREPAKPGEALERVASWLEQPGAFVLNPGTGHLDVLRRTLTCTAGGSLTTDAHLAALAIEHQAELHSNDSDFARFPGLRWRNPLDLG
jgi:toxin-antitoxin system PIN domain toxin